MKAKLKLNTSFMIRLLNSTILVVVVVGALYHLIATQFLLVSFTEHKNIHLAFALVLVLLTSLKKNPQRWPFLLSLIVLSLIATGYVGLFFTDLQLRAGYPTAPDMAIGMLLVFIALETSRQAFGPIIPSLAGIFIVYALLGHHLPQPFYHVRFTLDYIVSHLTVGLLGGLYGPALGVSVNYIFLFFLFGGILQVSGANEFFSTLGKLSGRRLRGGPAITAVVSSACVASVSGSSDANVAVTGQFTIPLMKKVGFKPEQAAAIEAAASTGGQFTPPVMGAAAFLMVGITGIPYVDIMKAAIIPAFLFFLSVGIYAELQARALKIPKAVEKINLKEMLWGMPLFVVPLGVLVFLLVWGFTPMYGAFWAIVSIFSTSLVISLLKKTRPSLSKFLEGFVIGATGGARIGVTAGVIGFLMSSVTMTGIGIKISGMVADWSGGSIFVACVITMFVCLLFGSGVPTIVSYLLVAMLATPVLIKMGVPVLQAHLFSLYFACLSAVSPPVAMSALVASGIARSSYLKTGVTAFKICLSSFIIPYLIIWNSAVILQFRSIVTGLASLIAICLGILSTNIVVTNYCMSTLKTLERIFFAFSAFLLFSYAFTINYAFFVGGTIVVVLVTLWNWRTSRVEEGVGITSFPRESYSTFEEEA